jgi:hypothetical protein
MVLPATLPFSSTTEPADDALLLREGVEVCPATDLSKDDQLSSRRWQPPVTHIPPKLDLREDYTITAGGASSARVLGHRGMADGSGGGAAEAGGGHGELVFVGVGDGCGDDGD